MPRVETLFVTQIYQAKLAGKGSRSLLADLERACLSIADDDAAGQSWCKANGYAGYTSYASLTDLPRRFPEFEELAAHLDRHVAAFSRRLDFDLGGKTLQLDCIWINVLGRGGFHASHIHPHSVVSGTIYIAVPDGAGAIRFEDPRLAQMMAAPPRKKRARSRNRSFEQVSPQAGTVLLWESWLRHEVLPSASREPRISVSFNYRWG